MRKNALILHRKETNKRMKYRGVRLTVQRQRRKQASLILSKRTSYAE
jgi:hypothetical protein